MPRKTQPEKSQKRTILKGQTKRVNDIAKRLNVLDVARITLEFGSVENLALMLDTKCVKESQTQQGYEWLLDSYLKALTKELAKPVESTITKEVLGQNKILHIEESSNGEKNTHQVVKPTRSYTQCKGAFFQPQRETLPIAMSLDDDFSIIESFIQDECYAGIHDTSASL